MIYQDYLLRLLQQLTRFVARILKLRDEKKPVEALKAVQTAFDELFGGGREWLKEVDSLTMASLLEDPETMKAYAQLLTLEGQLLEELGQLGLANMRLQSALELLLRAQLQAHAEGLPRASTRAQDPGARSSSRPSAQPTDDFATRIDALKAQLGPSLVAQAYRNVLGSPAQA